MSLVSGYGYNILILIKYKHKLCNRVFRRTHLCMCVILSSGTFGAPLLRDASLAKVII